jgi:hypothetical protein
MNTLLEMLGAADYLKNDQQARQVFDAIARSSTIPGWSLARTLSIDPDELEPILANLRSKGLIEGDAQGLDAFYFLSALGFRIGSFVA